MSKCNNKCCFCPVPGPTGPTGPAGEGSSGVFSGMYTDIGYPILTTQMGETLAALFNEQSLTQGDFSFEPGSIELNPYTLVPGTLIIGDPGIYQIYYIFSSVISSVDAQYDTAVTVNGVPILNSFAHLTMHPGDIYNMSRETNAALNAGDRLQVTVTASDSGLFIIGGNTSELLVTKIGEL